MKLTIFAVMVSLGFLISDCIFANDTIGALGAGGIEFKKTQDISMEKEVLTISVDKIRVDYEFLNITDSSIKETIVFPMPPLEPGCDRLKRGYDGDVGFTLWINGKERETTKALRAVSTNGIDVTNRLRKLGLTDDKIIDYNGYSPCEADWAPSNKDDEKKLNELVKEGLAVLDKYKNPRPQWEVSYFEYWEQEFPAKQIVKVSHEYSPLIGGGSGGYYYVDEDASPRSELKKLIDGGFAGATGDYYCVDEGTVRAILKSRKNGSGLHNFNNVEYILKTGANWSGPIKDFTLNLRKSDQFDVVSLCFDGHFNKTDPLTLTFHSNNFLPKKDIDVLFLYDR